MSGHRGSSHTSQLTKTDHAGRQAAPRNRDGEAAKRKHDDDDGINDDGQGDRARSISATFAQELEREFSHRYSSRDERYAKLASQPRSQPPIVYPW